MARLVDCFAPLFTFGLALDASADDARAGGGGAQCPNQCCDPHTRALNLLDAARSRAQDEGHSLQAIESAAYAVVAWLDEVLARRAGNRHAGGMPSLQEQLFNSRNAQSEFFHHLSGLLPEEEQLREVYWYALAHGFAGQYYFEDGEHGELGKLKDLHGQQLPVAPLSLDALAHEHITPQPYASAASARHHDPVRSERALLRSGGALALVLPLLCLLWLLLASPAPKALSLAQRIDLQLQRYPCNDLATSVDNQGNTRVHGFVSRPQDVEQVRSEVAAIPGVHSATVDIGVRVWPYCEVVSILKPYQARNRDKEWGLDVSAPSARGDRLREGDAVLLDVTNANYDGNIWVDYFTADGAVMHFHAGRNAPRLGAGEHIVLGRDIPSSWLVSPPFGTVLVTALSSPAPFADTAERPPFELASAYLLRLREMLASNRGGDRVVAEFLFLQTVER